MDALTTIHGTNGRKCSALCELAIDEVDRRKGLSGRPYIPHGTGMVFIPSSSFWMKDTLVPLDLVYVKDGVIVDIVYMAVADNPGGVWGLKSYRSKIPNTDYAVEYPAGWLSGRGVKVGDSINLVPLRI